MRSLASALALVVACSSPARPTATATTPAPVQAPKVATAKRAAKPHACATLAPVCDATIEDASTIEIVHRRCFACHDAGGVANHDFTSLAALRAAPIAQMIGTCQMPPDGEPPLAEADRRALVAWSACAR